MGCITIKLFYTYEYLKYTKIRSYLSRAHCYSAVLLPEEKYAQNYIVLHEYVITLIESTTISGKKLAVSNCQMHEREGGREGRKEGGKCMQQWDVERLLLLQELRTPSTMHKYGLIIVAVYSIPCSELRVGI